MIKNFFLYFLIPVSVLGAIGYWEAIQPSVNPNNPAKIIVENKNIGENGMEKRKPAVALQMEQVNDTVSEIVNKEEPVFVVDPKFRSKCKARLMLPLELLKSGRHAQVSDLIINRQMGVDDVDAETGWTLLHHLARSYNISALAWLLSHQIYGPDGINKRTSNGGQTPLHLALTHRNPLLSLLLTDLLMEYGASPDIPDAAGQTARQLLLNDKKLIAKKKLSVLNREYDPRIELKQSNMFEDVFGTEKPPTDPIFF